MITCSNGSNLPYNTSVLGIFFCSTITFTTHLLIKRKTPKTDTCTIVFINVADLMVVFNFYRILFSLLTNWKLLASDLSISLKKMKLEAE